MRRDPRLPPALAVWMLSRLLRGGTSDALIGDLREEYVRGRSRAWYWRQALCAAAAGWRERPARWFSLGALRLAMIACVIVGASLHSTWPFFLLALDPCWMLLVRRPRRHRTLRETEPCAR
jgi:hypothetical protein